MHIIAIQSSNGAKAFIGPFETQDDAHSWAKAFDYELWWHIELQSPYAPQIIYTVFTNG